MRILAIAADIRPNHLGGAEWHFLEILKRFPQDYTVDVVLASDCITDPKISALEKKGQLKQFPIFYPHIPNFFWASFILFSFPTLLGLCRRHHYNLIWAKQELPQGLAAVLLKWIFNIPIYLTTQSARLEKDELVVKGPMPSVVKIKLQACLTPLIALAFKHADYVGAVSNFAASVAKEHGAKKIAIVPNGVNIRDFRFANKKHHLPIKIVTTSSLINRNGLDTLLNSFAIVLKKCDSTLTIAGDGPLLKDLKHLAKILKIESKVHFLGRVTNQKIPHLLASSDIFVRLSRAEGFGSSFIEAQAAKIPVVATNIGGITDFLFDKKNALLVSPNNPESAAHAIELLILRKNLKRKIINNGYSQVRSIYNWDNISKKVANIFKDIARP